MRKTGHMLKLYQWVADEKCFYLSGIFSTASAKQRFPNNPELQELLWLPFTKETILV